MITQAAPTFIYAITYILDIGCTITPYPPPLQKQVSRVITGEEMTHIITVYLRKIQTAPANSWQKKNTVYKSKILLNIYLQIIDIKANNERIS